ncbi:MAG: M48 family metalloprotease [bacterium]
MQQVSLPKTASGKIKFPGISLKAIQHRFDAQATESLKKIPLLPQLLKFLNKIFSEEALYVIFTGQALRVTPRQYPRLYKVYREAIEILDLPYEPEFFLQTSQDINAYAIGMERRFVIVTSSLTEILSEEELLFVIAHELGHNKFDHMLNKTLAFVLGAIGVGVLSAILGGVGQLATLSLQLGLLHWSRMAEFSADRAGFLGVQDREVALRALAKLAGYSHKYTDENVNIEEVLLQAKQLDETNLLQTIHKYIAMVQMTHPFVPYRLRELDMWINSPEVQNILNGNYVTEEEFNRRFMTQQPYYQPPYPQYGGYPPQYPPYYQQPSPGYPQYQPSYQTPYQAPSYNQPQFYGQPQAGYQQPYQPYQPYQGSQPYPSVQPNPTVQPTNPSVPNVPQNVAQFENQANPQNSPQEPVSNVPQNTP